MNLKFWQRKREVRSQPYSDAIIAALAAAATNSESEEHTRTALEETCAGLWARGFCQRRRYAADTGQRSRSRLWCWPIWAAACAARAKRYLRSS